MFSVEDRDRARAAVLELAGSDPRVVAGAELGSRALGPGDQWSDLDLSFGLAEGVAVEDVLADWTPRLEAELGAVHLFDLPHLGFSYRVFLLPGNLQLDVSLATASQFGALGPKFKLLFGSAVERTPPPPALAAGIFGLGAHHAVRADFCLRRGRPWQAEHWIHELRDEALVLACRRRGLETANGRGYDQLPPETLALAAASLAAGVEEEELRRALRSGVRLLLAEAEEVAETAGRLRAQLLELG
jgi:hypothetical protein